MKSGAFASAASRRYGKFVNSSLDWQIYEPRDQAEIDTRLAEYAAAGVSIWLRCMGVSSATLRQTSLMWLLAHGRSRARSHCRGRSPTMTHVHS